MSTQGRKGHMECRAEIHIYKSKDLKGFPHSIKINYCSKCFGLYLFSTTAGMMSY